MAFNTFHSSMLASSFSLLFFCVRLCSLILLVIFRVHWCNHFLTSILQRPTNYVTNKSINDKLVYDGEG